MTISLYYIDLEYCVEAWVTRNAIGSFKNMFILTDILLFQFLKAAYHLSIHIIKIENWNWFWKYHFISKTQLRPRPTCMWLIPPDQIRQKHDFGIAVCSSGQFRRRKSVEKVEIFLRQNFDVRRRFDIDMIDASIFQRFLLDVQILRKRWKSFEVDSNVELTSKNRLCPLAGACFMY